MHRTGTILAAGVVALAALLPGRAHAGFTLSAYGGASHTADSDVELAEGADTRLTFRGVAWAGESRKRPVYYGLRATWWLPRAPAWGIALDYTHVKAIARLHREVQVAGTRGGALVDDTEILADTFDELAFSHGLNLATVSAVYHGPRGAAGGRTFWDRVRPCALLGAGVTVPHVQVWTADAEAHRYQVAGPAFVAGLGANPRLVGPLSALAEYRLSWAHVKVDLSPEGSIEFDPWTDHFALGLSCAVP